MKILDDTHFRKHIQFVKKKMPRFFNRKLNKSTKLFLTLPIILNLHMDQHTGLDCPRHIVGHFDQFAMGKISLQIGVAFIGTIQSSFSCIVLRVSIVVVVLLFL